MGTLRTVTYNNLIEMFYEGLKLQIKYNETNVYSKQLNYIHNQFLINQIAATIMLVILIHLCDSKITHYRNNTKTRVNKSPVVPLKIPANRMQLI